MNRLDVRPAREHDATDVSAVMSASGGDLWTTDMSPAMAARSLLKSDGQTTPPVDLAAIVDRWPGLRVSIEALDGPGYLLDLGVAGGEIMLREQDPIPRRRFTLAHELGHWLTRNECAEDAPSRAGNPINHRNARLERWCDRFAVELLLPGEWIAADLDACPPNRLLSFLLRCPARYRTSRTATWHRISETSPISVIVHRGAEKPDEIYFSHQLENSSKLALRRWADEIVMPDRVGVQHAELVTSIQVWYIRPSRREELLAVALPATST